MGCKRIIVDPGYLECLHRPNVTLSWGAIRRIVPQGLELETGEIVSLDVLILGTGFSLVRHPLNENRGHKQFPLVFNSCPLAWKSLELKAFGFPTIGSPRVVPKPIMVSRCHTFPTTSRFLVCPQYWPGGTHGTDLTRSVGCRAKHRRWTCVCSLQRGGAGMCVWLGSNPELLSSCASLNARQIEHAMQLIKPILTGAVRSLAVREEASSKYNSWVQKRQALTVWAFCDSYYRRESANGKNFATFPGPVSLFWWLARRPRFSDYETVSGERWQRADLKRVF